MGHARSCRLSRPRGHRRRAGAHAGRPRPSRRPSPSGRCHPRKRPVCKNSGRPILMLDERLAFLRTVAAIGGRPHLAGQRLAKAQREAAKLRKARDVFVGRQIGRSAETAWWTKPESNHRPLVRTPSSNSNQLARCSCSSQRIGSSEKVRITTVVPSGRRQVDGSNR
jgi:hypothetical protein